MTDRSRLRAGRHVGYLPTEAELAEMGGSPSDVWDATILVAHPDGSAHLHVLRPDGQTATRAYVEHAAKPGGFSLALAPIARSSVLVSAAFPTVHFNVGNVGTPALGTPGTLTAAAAALFGQLNIRDSMRVGVTHLHLCEGGSSGTLTIELFRRRPGLTGAFTRIATLSATNTTPDFGYVGAVPVDDLALLEAGDYLFAQATAGTLVTAGGADGITLDIHAAAP